MPCDPDSDPVQLARARLREDLLGWGQPRPRVPHGLVEELRQRLQAGLDELDLDAVRRAQPDGRLWVTRRHLDQLAGDEATRDARPYEHTWSNVRAALLRRAMGHDTDRRHDAAGDVVLAAWRELASDRPGDPRSVAAWLNSLDAAQRATMVEQVVQLLDGFREVWPSLAGVQVHTEVRIRHVLGEGGVVLVGTPTMVLRSHHQDDRCRTLVVDLTTGRPRSERARRRLRFHALLVTLEEGRPPFRWGTHYVVEGRSEFEDLDPEVLRTTADRVVEAVGQAVRPPAPGDEADPRPPAGAVRCHRPGACSDHEHHDRT